MKPDNFNDENHQNDLTGEFKLDHVFSLGPPSRKMSEQISSPGHLSGCKIKSELIKRNEMNITPLKEIQKNNEDNLK